MTSFLYNLEHLKRVQKVGIKKKSRTDQFILIKLKFLKSIIILI